MPARSGTGRTRKRKLMTIWVAQEAFPYIDLGVRIEDVDRSKFVRRAVREKLARMGIKMTPAAAD